MISVLSNVTSLRAQQALARNQSALNTSLERLSTGLRINTAADDPAGLIASENLRAQEAGINAAISNATRASNVLSTADGGLSQVSSLLIQLQGLVSSSANTAGLNAHEVAANQLQVDSILQTIDRLSGGTVFEGQSLLSGNFDYTTSGVNASKITNLQIQSARANTPTNVVVNVTQSAQTAHLGYTGGTVGASGVTIEVKGNKGSTDFSFAAGTTITAITAAITSSRAVTGVSAAISGTGINISSIGYGASSFVTVTAVSGAFTGAGTAKGRDAAVTINGTAAHADGLNVSTNSGNLSLSLTLAAAGNTLGQTSFAITGGGANFQIGPSVNQSSFASIGLAAVSTAGLGGLDLGSLSSLASGGANAMTGKSLTNAQDILTASISQVSTLRGRIGAFIKYDLGSSIDNLQVQLENVTAADSAIRDTDYAAEISNFTRLQILVQAGTSVLSQANQQPNLALQLLRSATGQ